MEFTKKEYEEILTQRAKAIEQFIKTEIQPHITKEFKISFGDIVHRGRYNEIKEHEFTLYIRNDEIFGMIGGLAIYFNMPEYLKGCCGCIDIYNHYSYGGRFIYYLCLNWQHIKAEMLAEMNKQKQNKNAVFDEFTI